MSILPASVALVLLQALNYLMGKAVDSVCRGGFHPVSAEHLLQEARQGSPAWGYTTTEMPQLLTKSLLQVLF